jgi:hypothetical protein
MYSVEFEDEKSENINGEVGYNDGQSIRYQWRVEDDQ